MTASLTQCQSAVQVLRYTLYGKERSTFVDASFLRNDWWQRVRDLFNPPKTGQDGESGEEEDAEGEVAECTGGTNPRSHSLLVCWTAAFPETLDLAPIFHYAEHAVMLIVVQQA